MKSALIKNLCVAALSVIAADMLLAQLGQRLVPAWRNERLERATRIPHPVFHHGLAPGAAFVHRYGTARAAYFTNSLGLRDASTRDAGSAAGKRRVFIIGDSMTEGLGVPFEDTFAGRMAAAGDAHGIDVLNGAVMSYAGSVYYSKTRHLIERDGMAVDGVVVFIDISDMEDEVRCYRLGADNVVHSTCLTKVSTSRTLRAFFRENSVGYRLYHTLKAHVRATQLRDRLGPLGSVTNLTRSRWTLDDRLYAEIGRPGLERNAEALDKLHAFLSARGIPLTLAVYPWPDQILAQDLNAKQVTYWQSWAAARGARFVNLFPAFIDARDPRAVIAEDFIPYDVHFNAAGHARVAKAFLATVPIAQLIR